MLLHKWIVHILKTGREVLAGSMKMHVFMVMAVLLPLTVCFAQSYVVDEGDVLKIAVYDHNDLLTTARVAGDGTIVFPLVGRVNVAGLTAPQISREISGLLSNGYIIDPQVSVFVKEFRNKGVFYIIGEVKKPDAYAYTEGTTVIKAITVAGGFTGRAAKDRVRIIRKVNGTEKLMEKVDIAEPVLPDDLIVVPESFF